MERVPLRVRGSVALDVLHDEAFPTPRRFGGRLVWLDVQGEGEEGLVASEAPRPPTDVIGPVFGLDRRAQTDRQGCPRRRRHQWRPIVPAQFHTEETAPIANARREQPPALVGMPDLLPALEQVKHIIPMPAPFVDAAADTLHDGRQLLAAG